MNATSDGSYNPQQGISILGGMLIAFSLSWFSAVWAAIPWDVIYIYLRRHKLRYYTLIKKEDCKRIQKRVQEHSSHTTDNNKGYGYAFGKWYFLYIKIAYDEDLQVWMIATEDSYKQLVKETDDKEEDAAIELATRVTGTTNDVIIPAKRFQILDRRGSYSNLWYRSRKLKSLTFTPWPEQVAIIDRIRDIYSSKGRGVFFIHGPPCTGKSFISLFLAEHFNAYYCNSFTPWEPGDTLSNLTDEVELAKEKPLIVSFDEVDVAIHQIHTGIPSHKNVPTLIRDKTGWNRFLDNFQRGISPYVIIIMTSNKTPDFIDTFDLSYLRMGRVDEIFELKQKVE